MSRLTARGADGHAYFPECFKNPKCRGEGCGDYKCRFMDDVAERLARYEDTEDGAGRDDGGKSKYRTIPAELTGEIECIGVLQRGARCDE